MNIVFWVLVALVAFLVWCGLSYTFKSIGKWWIDEINKVKQDMNDEEGEE